MVMRIDSRSLILKDWHSDWRWLIYLLILKEMR
jgi:hypothetical protein